MRASYLLMVVGLALKKWPLLPDAHTMPLYEGVTLCILVAMSLLAFLGLRYPVKLLPLLLFESAWSSCGSAWSRCQRPSTETWTRPPATSCSTAPSPPSFSRSSRGVTFGATTCVRAETGGDEHPNTADQGRTASRGQVHDQHSNQRLARAASNALQALSWPVHTDRLTLRPATTDDLAATWDFRRLDDVARGSPRHLPPWRSTAPASRTPTREDTHPRGQRSGHR